MKLLLIVMLSVSSAMGSVNALKKTYYSVGGVVVFGFMGGLIGKSLSPNEDSDDFNRNIGMVSGAIIGGLLGYYLADKSIENSAESFKGEDIELDYSNNSELQEIQEPTTLDNLGLRLRIPPMPKGIYREKITEQIPSHLKSNLSKQIVIEREIPEQVFKRKDGSTLILKNAKLIEHRYER